MCGVHWSAQDFGVFGYAELVARDHGSREESVEPDPPICSFSDHGHAFDNVVPYFLCDGGNHRLVPGVSARPSGPSDDRDCRDGNNISLFGEAIV